MYNELTKAELNAKLANPFAPIKLKYVKREELIKMVQEASTSKTQKPGVINTIAKALRRGYKTKDELVEMLSKTFPERDPDKMRTTVNAQVVRMQKVYAFAFVLKGRKKAYKIVAGAK